MKVRTTNGAHGMDSLGEGLRMAGDWIKMRVDLSDNNKVWLLSANLGLDTFAIVGRLHRLWSWADKNTKDGTLRATEAMVDKVVEHPGFAKALVDVQWLLMDGDKITFPEFDRHNGQSAKKRAREAERMRGKRDVRLGSEQKANSERTKIERGANKKRTASEQNANQRREEESREETKGEESPLTPSCSEPQAASEPPVAFPVFETVGREEDPKRWELTAGHVGELREAYPGVDISAEARKAWQWVRSNPQNRKTAKGMPAFLNTWMRRQQDRAGPRLNFSQKPEPYSGLQKLAARDNR